MPNFKFVIQYDGTRYNGWQRQPDTDNTIQGKIEDVLTRMAPEQPYPIHLASAGRTDAGVHAAAQIANIHLETDMSCAQIRDYCNTYLPEDIGIVAVEKAGERFHARLSATGKTYVYRIALDPASHVFERKFMTPVKEITERLEANEKRGLTGPATPLAVKLLTSGTPDLEAMRKAAERLTGTHDFAGFCSRKMKKSTVRTVKEIRIEQMDGELRLSFNGDGFLYNMVRILTGTLMEVGFHLRTEESVEEILAQASRNISGFTAPARGLMLKEVYYS